MNGSMADNSERASIESAKTAIFGYFKKGLTPKNISFAQLAEALKLPPDADDLVWQIDREFRKMFDCYIDEALRYLYSRYLEEEESQ